MSFYSRYPTVADGGLGLDCLDYSFLLIDKSELRMTNKCLYETCLSVNGVQPGVLNR